MGYERYPRGDDASNFGQDYKAARGRFDGGRENGHSDHASDAVRYRDRGLRHARSRVDQEYDERGFLAEAGDEQYGERWAGDRDADYHDWRRAQIAAFDRDYAEYRRERRAKFESDFAEWRARRQSQRESIGKIAEHMEVLGADGAHVGTVDKVRDDRVLLTRSDAESGGRHHSIPSGWIGAVDGAVKLVKTAEEAKQHWHDEEGNQALFGDGGRDVSSPSMRELLEREKL